MTWITTLFASIPWATVFTGIGLVTIGIVFLASLLCIFMPDEVQELYYPEDAE